MQMFWPTLHVVRWLIFSQNLKCVWNFLTGLPEIFVRFNEPVAPRAPVGRRSEAIRQRGAIDR